MKPLRDMVGDGGVHVLDGAMGTMLYSRGVFVNVCYDELNLKQPRLVQGQPVPAHPLKDFLRELVAGMLKPRDGAR